MVLSLSFARLKFKVLGLKVLQRTTFFELAVYNDWSLILKESLNREIIVGVSQTFISNT